MGRSRLWGLIAVALALAILLGAVWQSRERRSRDHPVGNNGLERAIELAALEAKEREAEQTVWATELDAQHHEDVFLGLWDALNRSDQPLNSLAEFAFGTIELGAAPREHELQHGIRWFKFGPSPTGAESKRFSPLQWRQALQEWIKDGWQLGRTSWREILFSPATREGAARSVIASSGQLTNAQTGQKSILRGEFEIVWTPAGDRNGQPTVRNVAVKTLDCFVRSGPPPFIKIFSAPVPPSPGAMLSDPLLVHDLDGNGRSEIIMVGANTLFRSTGATFATEVLGPAAPELVVAAVLLDLSRDGKPDLLVGRSDGLVLYENDGEGRFRQSPRILWTAPEKLKHPQVITAGDIDRDGDLDVWLAQYKLPYQGGQFPTPYFDSNDGFPGFLLRNDGEIFSDVTEPSGLGARRHRRTYSASFVDLDANGTMDLVNVSDFAGIDLFSNDGSGRFTDATKQLGDARHLFGMAHAVGDLNQDGSLDLFAVGMESSTARRLDALGLHRLAFPQHGPKRAAMTFGNRLFLGGRAGFLLAPFARQIAHAGWAWGVSLVDIDNDGDLDMAIANGHETRPSVRDYERQFWLHDIYVGSSNNDPVANHYFKAAAARRDAEQGSYGGWQDNVLFLNDRNVGFIDVAFLMGFIVPEDSQNLVSDDVDGDGSLDLIVTTFGPWPERRPTLHVYRNSLAPSRDWIGFRFDSLARTWAGARVVIVTSAGTQSRWLVTGDSYRSQHAPAVHFGFGDGGTFVSAEVVWPDGSTVELSGAQTATWNVVGPTGATVPSP